MMCSRRACRRMPVLISALLLVTAALLAQPSRVELINADISRGEVLPGGEPIRILEGNVHVRQDTLEIFCDKATYYRTSRKVLMVGNVRMIRGVEVLTARQVTYFDARRVAIAERDVHLTRPGQAMRSHYLEYYYDTDEAYARDRLWLKDDESRVTITGREGRYLPAEARSIVRGNARLRQDPPDAGDTLRIDASTLEYRFSGERLAVAVDTVVIRRGDLTAWCDSATYVLDREVAFLNREPRARQAGNALTGQEMTLQFNGSSVDHILVKGMAVATSVEDSVAGRVNRLSGQEIRAFLAEGRLRELVAVTNARSTYYIKEDDVEQGINTASADTIQIGFAAGNLETITVKSGSQGTFYPADFKGKIETE